MAHANKVVYHFSNLRVIKCVKKTFFQDLHSKTDDPSLRRQFPSFFSRYQDLRTCIIIVFIDNLLSRDFPGQPYPVNFPKKCHALRKLLFHFVFIFLFFFYPVGSYAVKPSKPLAPEAVKIGCFFKSKKKSGEST